MKIPAETVQRVKDGIDIVEVVQEHVRLERRGKDYVGLCPFHEEKTASFRVDPDKQRFKCFGCTKEGDVFDFVGERERVGFPEAVRSLAKRVGEPVPEAKEGCGKHAEVYHALRFASEYFAGQLHETTAGASALAYLRDRGLTERTVERFQLGYAPESWEGILKAAEAVQIRPETLLRAGLVAKRKSGGYYDRFRNRVIFPIWSHIGKIVGFGGRALAEGPRTPKYLNSPETEVYHKSLVLYGLHQSKRDAMRDKKILLVEGYTDTLALDQVGVASVACCGIALTVQQAKLLAKYVAELTLLFDADNAGGAATFRAIDCALENGLDVGVVALPAEDDPDSYVQKVGGDGFKDYVREQRRSWVSALHLQAKDKNMMDTPQGVRSEIGRVAERLLWVRDALLRKIYLREAGKLFGVTQSDLAQEMSALKEGGGERNKERGGANAVLEKAPEMGVSENDGLDSSALFATSPYPLDDGGAGSAWEASVCRWVAGQTAGALVWDVSRERWFFCLGGVYIGTSGAKIVHHLLCRAAAQVESETWIGEKAEKARMNLAGQLHSQRMRVNVLEMLKRERGVGVNSEGSDEFFYPDPYLVCGALPGAYGDDDILDFLDGHLEVTNATVFDIRTMRVRGGCAGRSHPPDTRGGLCQGRICLHGKRCCTMSGIFMPANSTRITAPVIFA